MHAAPPSMGSNDADPGRILTVWCADAPMTGALLDNVMTRVKERGRLVSVPHCWNMYLGQARDGEASGASREAAARHDGDGQYVPAAVRADS